MKRWIVRKGGDAQRGYTLGWFAMSADGQQGLYLPDFGTAINYATAEADEQFAREQGRVAKHAARPSWGEVATWFDTLSTMSEAGA